MNRPHLLLAAAGALVLAGGSYVALRYGAASPRTTGASAVATGTDRQQAATPEAPVAAREPIADEETARGSEIAAEMAALGQEMARLRATVADLRRQSRKAARETEETEGSGGEDAPGESKSDSYAQAQEEERRLKTMDTRDLSFRQEAADTPWASQTAAKVSKALEDLAIAATGIRDLECRAQTCRIEIAADAVAAAGDESGNASASLDKTLPMLALQLAESLPSMDAFQVNDGRGGTNTVLYFSRDVGQSPPTPPGR